MQKEQFRRKTKVMFPHFVNAKQVGIALTVALRELVINAQIFELELRMIEREHTH